MKEDKKNVNNVQLYKIKIKNANLKRIIKQKKGK